MGGGNLANLNKKRGFAISGILYPLLILTLFLVVQMLFMLQTRKNVLDKARTELADSINSSNQVYNNEELSNLLDEQRKISEQLKIQLDDLQSNYNSTSNNVGYYNTTGNLKVKKLVYGKYFSDNKNIYAKIKMANLNINSYAMVLATIKIYEYKSYNTINVAGYLYGPDGIHAPSVSYLNRTNMLDVYFGIDKSTLDAYIIIDIKAYPWVAVYIDEIAISHNASINLDSGWDISGTNNLDNMTLYKCAVL